MIITQPAVDVIRQTFSFSRTRHPKLPRFGRAANAAKPFTSQAYAEQGILTPAERARAMVSASLNPSQQRKSLA
jgi:hypothetical protein